MVVKMFNEIYMAIFQRKLNDFVNIFSGDAKKIFHSDLARNNLIHSGEFGQYRERAVKEVLSVLLKSEYAISDGFIITANNKISTQCDIIVHKKEVPPLISNNIAKMFPVEDVRIIGEIKSDINNLSTFKKILIKLAENKMLLEERKSQSVQRQINQKQYDTIGSFLVCNKLGFDINEIDYKKIYKGIPRKFWHNMILSINDGALLYKLDFNEASERIKNDLQKSNYDISNIAVYEYPEFFWGEDIIRTEQNSIIYDENNPQNHLIQFFLFAASCAEEVWGYEHDPVVYLGLNKEPFFI